MRPRSNSVELLLFEVQNAFDPNSNFIHVWQQLLLVCVIYEISILPFLVVFRETNIPSDTAELVLVYVCEIFFLADIYVELNTGFYEGGDVTRDARKSRVSKTSVSIAFFEMHKLVRIWKIPKYISQLDDVYAKYFVVLKMFKVLLSILLLSHFIACIRFLFGYDEHGEDHWLPHMPHHEQTSRTKYLMSIFWAFGVMTGLFEGELPHSIPAFIFTISVAICGFLLFTYLCATFFMISKCETVGYLKRYYTYAESNDREAMRLLCPSIRKDVQVALMKDRVASVVIFQGCSEQLIVAITSLLEMLSLPAYFVVFKAGDRGDAMFFVNSGVLHVMVDGVKVREERKGDFFGEMSVFLNGPRHATVVTNTYCTLYTLARFHLERVLDGYPEYAKLITKQVEEMARRIFSGKSRDLLPDPKSGKGKAISRLLRKHLHNEKAKPSLGWVVASAVVKKEIHVQATDDAPVKPTLGWLVANAVAKKELIAPAQESGETSAKPSLGLLMAKAAAKKKLLLLAQANGEASLKSDLALTCTTTQPPTIQDSDLTPAANPIPVPVEDKLQSSSQYLAQQTPPSPDKLLEVSTDSRSGSTTKSSGQEQPAEAVVPLTLPVTEPKPDRRTSLTMPPVTQMVAAQLTLKKDSKAPFWSVFLLHKAIDFESKRRLWWILTLEVNLVYFWFVIPTRLAFEVLNHPSWLITVLNVLMEIALWVDIYLNFNLSYLENSEKIWNTTCTAKRYLKTRFAFDLLCALPHWVMGSEFLRLLRLLRMRRVLDHVKEVDELLHLDNKKRLLLFGWLMMMLYHTVACLHFSISYLEGFSSSPHAWLPSSDLHLRRLNETHYIDADNATYAVGSSEIIEIGLNQYFRSLYYACYVITALGRPVEPASDTQFGAALVFMLSGFFITAIVVDNVQKRFTASAFEQKEFFANRTRIQLFLMRQNAPLAIHKRVSNFLDYWWSAHRGAVIGSLLEELPTSIKNDIMKSICKPSLQTVALLAGVRPVLNELEQLFIDNVRFILYGQGEVVYRQGDFAGGLFFLLEGELCRVMTISGCIMSFISREHLLLMKNTFPALPEALEALEKRLLDPKFLKASAVSTGAAAFNKHNFITSWFSELVFDPDSGVMIAWETWVFLVMTVQCVVTVSVICFPVPSETMENVDIIIFLIEMFFVIDLFVRFRLGFHAFGNKVMDLRVIKNNYMRSRSFVIDALALLPLYFIDWGLASMGQHLEILNLNKLLRLFKVPAQFAALENKHLKYTLQLRLFKLVYYTFILSHTLGCFYFDFRSHASHMHRSGDNEGSHATTAHWLAGESLLEKGYPLQYFTSLFWSFGVMSATYPGELPKTTSQCLFNTITLTFGFFLFALPLPIQERFKAYFFFRRFHSITQEHLLESCLPPSLLTDIRMVHLQPMIVKVSFLAGMNGSVTRMLVSHFNQVMIVKDEFVYKYGEEGSDMYFVFAGLLDTLIPREEELKQRAAMSGRRTSQLRRTPTATSVLTKKPSIKPRFSSRKTRNSRSTPSIRNKSTKEQSKLRIPKFVAVLFRGAPAQSFYHLAWVKVIIFATLFMSIVVPYRISFDSMEHTEWLPVVIRELEILCEVFYIADIWVNWRIQRSRESVDLYEQDHRETYKSERLVCDILAAIPLDYLVSSFSNDPLRSITKAMYFVVRGYLFSTSESQPDRTSSYGKGIYFGEKGLLVCSVSTCSIRTLRACDLLSLGPDSLLRVLKSHRVTKLAYEIATQAVQIVKAKERVASSVTATESEWGEAVMAAIRLKHAEVRARGPSTDDAASADVVEEEFNAAVRSRKHVLELLGYFATLERAIDTYGAFRPLLQLIVPNGQLHNAGGATEQSGDNRLTMCESEVPTTVPDEQQVQALAIIGRLLRRKNNTVAPLPLSINSKPKQEGSVLSEAADSLMQHESAQLIPAPTLRSTDNKSRRESTSSSRQISQPLLPALPPLEAPPATPTESTPGPKPYDDVELDEMELFLAEQATAGWLNDDEVDEVKALMEGDEEMTDKICVSKLCPRNKLSELLDPAQLRPRDIHVHKMAWVERFTRVKQEDEMEVWCLLVGEKAYTPLPVLIKKSCRIHDLQLLLKGELFVGRLDVRANTLNVYVARDDNGEWLRSSEPDKKALRSGDATAISKWLRKRLDPLMFLGDVFQSFEEGIIHDLVVPPEIIETEERNREAEGTLSGTRQENRRYRLLVCTTKSIQILHEFDQSLHFTSILQ
ncbi:Cyclic nucleotide-binding-like [Phytophthora cactorum]|nr:Cyclic nucleotide-binding-like [Phytophthora cactorum]